MHHIIKLNPPFQRKNEKYAIGKIKNTGTRVKKTGRRPLWQIA